MSGSGGIETRPGNTLEHDPAFVKESFARFLTNRLFPHLQHDHPDLFIADVQFINDWQYAAKWSPHDPLNLKVGDYASNRAAAIASAQWLHKSKQTALLHALQQGDTTGARRILQTEYPNPVTHHRLNITHHDLAYPLNPETGTAKRTGMSAVDKALNSGASDSVAGALGGLGNLGSMFKSPVVLIALVLILVLLLKK